ncbi:metalloregulator ArsR/SmtB family transcription factor [Agrobacterium sp. CR_3]|uniref:ArsR/SmtB family transcription factor n=1 Tax=unclassified Agrobacterium TaxID=2632611 RepID=UPI0035BEFDD9
MSGTETPSKLTAQQSEHAARMLSAMANPVRLAILQLLVQSETSVSAICEHVGMSQSAVSQHLAKLRNRKLVATRRDAQTIYYTIHSASVLILLKTLNEIKFSRPGDSFANSF